MNSPSLTLSWRWHVGMFAFVVLFTLVGYAALGRPDAWHLVPGQVTDVQLDPADAAGSRQMPASQDVARLLSQLEQRVDADPKDAESWAALGRLYAATGQHEAAIHAYRQATQLVPDRAQWLADLADALSVTQSYRMSGEPEQLLQKALRLEPDNFKALSLWGMVSYEKQDFREAAIVWSRALARAPAGLGELTGQMTRARDDAAQRAGLTPQQLQALVPEMASAAQTAAADAAAAQVSGRVSLSPALAARVQPDDTVFIFARPVEGSRMPLAILRKQVRDLPLDFTLTQAMAMSPDRSLATVQQVVVGARVSRSGQAMPQAGDLQGLSAPTSVGATDIRIEIAQEISP